MSDPQPATLLVLGFGPFQDVTDNPAARLAAAVHGHRAGRALVHGAVMPVSYRRCQDRTRELVQSTGAVGVLGIGVARGRPEAAIEMIGRNHARGLDVDEICPTTLHALGPPALHASEAASRLASALSVAQSTDAGHYVCNAWLYGTLHASQRAARGHNPLPVAFLHIPDAGFPPGRLLEGLRTAWGQLRAPGRLA